jgi:hypothetical protein
MYAFRKPFTAAGFTSTQVHGIDFKTVLVVSQVLGYMLSKVLGIKVISEMPPARRARRLLELIAAAELSLILFGVVPRPWNAGCLFLNGLALGLVWGLVMGFLEGRQQTEALAAGLCASFILAGGAMKSTGAWILGWNVSEDWMPAVAGLLFLVPFGVSVAMLAAIPQPSARDVEVRNARHVMPASERLDFLRRHFLGLVPLLILFLSVTLLRSIRDDFAPEIWQALGTPAAPATFSLTELWVALGVTLVNGAAVLIVDNRRAFFAALAVCAGGFVLLAATLLGQQATLVSSFAFMVLFGLGLYLPYVAMHTTVFERMLALTRDRGNVGFLMYLADSVGYLAYVAVLLARQFWSADVDFLVWLIGLCWAGIAVSLICLVASWRHFAAVHTNEKRE